ncbi:hypothetical protein QBC34DRAFT_452402 [Podospora aff. communis PSN243]|uniref:Short chain dehydrogenase n=1 Tax=Podospora aff. communis PSN243 TaxID=3040156 RepID=A0AAV9G7X6_9PEZI|nr:hypothetical protein QBC34DRAFT_452402 [Podospora aff. communis PSN243]
MSPTVLVVGANRGLGLQFALQYLKKGFNVCGTFRKESADEARELLESGAKTFNLDLADETSIFKASASFGDQPLDLLINCAADGPGPRKCFDNTTEEFMHKFRVSAVGPFLVTKAFHSQIKKSESPFVVNITSSMGFLTDNKTGGDISYRTSKAALNMITVDLARELAPGNISCVAMSPGWVKTKMSGFTGHMEAPEAVERMIKVIDGLKPGTDTATSYHRDGQRLPWTVDAQTRTFPSDV